MSEHNLREMYEYANEVLENTKPEDVEGAINWGDLRCTDVVMSVSVHGDIWIRVDIEEADPHNPELREYMEKKLWEKFPDAPNFEINTEW
jgi:hypothetical protein